MPDRDKLVEMLPVRRVATPSEIFWELTDSVVREHYWIAVEAPGKGKRVEAVLRGQRIEITRHGVERLRVTLDARLCDLSAPLTLVVDGDERPAVARPSLRVLCSSMLRRGDRDLAGSCEIVIE